MAWDVSKYILIYNGIKICLPTISVIITMWNVLHYTNVMRICLCHKKHIRSFYVRVNVCFHNDRCQKPDSLLSDKMFGWHLQRSGLDKKDEIDTRTQRESYARWKNRCIYFIVVYLEDQTFRAESNQIKWTVKLNGISHSQHSHCMYILVWEK